MDKKLALLAGTALIFLLIFGVVFLKGAGDTLKFTHNVADNGSIDADKIDLDIAAIYSRDIADQSIRSIDLAANSVGRSEIKTGAVRGAEIATGAVRSAEIAVGAVRISEIATGAVGAYEILDGHVRSAEIATGAVHNSELSANAVTSDKILDGTITYADIDNINFDNTADLRLTALGYQAGNAIAATGYRNTLVGYQAGDLITTGTDNTAFGNNALGATTTTANNTAIGSNALALNTDTNNTAVGYNALTLSSTGNGNTAIGSKALDANTTGDYNVAIGYDALGANTLSSSNTAIGYNAMAANQSTGNRNVAIGRNALDASTNGVWNVAVGYGTLGNGENVDSSVALGYLALSSAIGNNNIGIGYQAGNSITSGGSNIAIGYDADVPGATLSNQLNIGGLLWGDLSSGYLAIGGSVIPTGAFLEINQNVAGGVAHIELNPIATPPLTDVDMGDIYMDTDGVLYIRSTSVWAAANTSADFSELIVPKGFGKETHDGAISYAGDIEAGDLVVINSEGYYERSSTPYDSSVAGVESGDRGRFRLKAGSFEREEGQRQVGMMGHILVKVSIENGPIRPGDSLTTSSLPGYAMKATRPVYVVGRAIKSFDGRQGRTGMIEVLVNLSWFGGIR